MVLSKDLGTRDAIAVGHSLLPGPLSTELSSESPCTYVCVSSLHPCFCIYEVHPVPLGLPCDDEKAASHFSSCVAFASPPPGLPLPLLSTDMGFPTWALTPHKELPTTASLDTLLWGPWAWILHARIPLLHPVGTPSWGSPSPSCCGSLATGSSAARSHATLSLKNALIQDMSRRGKA